MKEKKKTEIATNVSSGAEKVEVVQERLKNSREENSVGKSVKTTLKKTTDGKEEKIDVKKMNAQSTDGKAERESEAAKARVQAALKKKEAEVKTAEEKAQTRKARMAEKEKTLKERLAERRARAEKRAAERKAKAEKKAAERKAKAEKRLAEKKALAEKRKAEKEARIRERAHGKANRSSARERERAKRRENRKRKNSSSQNRESRKGYGGWLAAVIALGTVTLGLTAVVTIGAIDMNRTKDSAMSGYKSTMYELIGVMEHVDNDLDRVRISASPVQQERILTDLLVQARLAELDLEKMPISIEADRNLTTFINRVAAESERLLTKLRNGETLSGADAEKLQRLYETNHTARQQLDEFVANYSDNMLMEYLKKGEGELKSVLENLENLTLEENRLGAEENFKKGGEHKERNEIPTPGEGEKEGKIDTSKAEELCKEYFSEYKIGQFQCIGETSARGMTAYNVQGYDENGNELFAEIDVRSGELVRFNYYEPCSDETFDLENSKMIAQQFLQKLGYEDMVAVRVRENATDADFTYVYETDGVAFYPDTVKVKVCRTRGLVSGFEAEKYLRHHKERSVPETKISLETAQGKLHEGLEVEASRLAVVKAKGGECAAYEFLCSYGEEKYFVYTDANTGEELSIVNVKSLG